MNTNGDTQANDVSDDCGRGKDKAVDLNTSGNLPTNNGWQKGEGAGSSDFARGYLQDPAKKPQPDIYPLSDGEDKPLNTLYSEDDFGGVAGRPRGLAR